MKNLLFILFNLILIHTKTNDIYEEVWEICKYELKKKGQNDFGIIDPNNLITNINKTKLFFELKKMKKNIKVSLYFVLLNQFSGNIDILMNYLVDKFKIFPMNNDHSLLIFIEKTNHNFAIKVGKFIKNLINNQTIIEEILSNKKDLIMNNSFYDVFNDIILDVYHKIGGENYITTDDDDEDLDIYEFEYDDPFGEKQYDWFFKNYEEVEEQEIYIDEFEKKVEKNDNNNYDYNNNDKNLKENEKENEKEDEKEKENENLIGNKEKNLKNNEKYNKTLFKYLFFIVLLVLFIIFYLYLRLRKKLKNIKFNALNYVFLENKDSSLKTNI